MRLPRKRGVRRISPRARPPDPEWSTPYQVTNAEHWRHVWHEQILKRWDLSRSDIAVAGVLMHAYNIERAHARIGLARIAVRAGCSRSMAQRATKNLQERGLVKIQNAGTRTKDGQLATHEYRLTYESRGVF